MYINTLAVELVEIPDLQEHPDGIVDEQIDLINIEVDIDDLHLDDRTLKKFTRYQKELIRIVDQAGGVQNLILAFPKRSETEVKRGCNIAISRGANLNEVYVYNSLFKISNGKITDDALALTWPAVPGSDREWILLFPVDTERTIVWERRTYFDAARELTMFKYRMDPDYHSFLIENMDELDINERCAQTIMHEFGHVLHCRMFSNLDLHSDRDRFIWFHNVGYLANVAQRFPLLGSLPTGQKFYYLCESIAEDYRISLNMKAKNGMFILPNKITYYGDFQDPQYLHEGVTIMEKMLGPVMDQNGSSKQDFRFELDRVKLAKEIRTRAEQHNWSPGDTPYTEADFLKDLESFDEDGSLKEEEKRELALS